MNTFLGHGFILWYDLSNETGTLGLVRGMLGACIEQVYYSSCQGISKIYIGFSGCAGSEVGQRGHSKSRGL